MVKIVAQSSPKCRYSLESLPSSSERGDVRRGGQWGEEKGLARFRTNPVLKPAKDSLLIRFYELKL
jgi:hypothetical protein